MTNQTATPHELKHCPFCGSNEIAIERPVDFAAIQCQTCGCGTDCDDDENVIVAKWNTRSPDLDSPALVDEVAKAICESVESDVFDELAKNSIIRAAYVQQAQAAIAAIRKAL